LLVNVFAVVVAMIFILMGMLSVTMWMAVFIQM